MKDNNKEKEEKWVKEFSRMKARKERAKAGMCATCGSKENHDERGEFGTFTHQWDSGVDAWVWNEIDFISDLLAARTEQKAREAVEAEREKIKNYQHGFVRDDGTGEPERAPEWQVIEDLLQTLTQKD